MEESRGHEQWLRELLRDEDFMVFMQEQPGIYASKESFFAQDVPGGIAAETAWDLVSFMRRMSASPSVREYVPLAGKDVFDLSHWCTPPRTLEILGALYAETGAASQLWHNVEPLLARGRLQKPIVEDLHASAVRDGLALDCETVRAIVRGERMPASDEERIVANTASLLRDVDGFAWPLTGEVLQALYGRIVEGVDTFSGRRSALPPTPYAELFVRDTERPFDMVAERLVVDGRWGSQPLLGLIMNSAIIWGRWPFPHCNEFMEMVVRWVYVRHVGVPALRAVPATKLRLDWEMGLMAPDVAPFRYGEAVAVSDFGVDNTPYLIVMANLLQEGVARLRAEVDRIYAEDAREKAAIEADGRLNHRQQQLLCAMVDDPRRVTDVAAYAERFDTAVSTAREDLNKLVGLGLCLTEFHGKKQVFWRRRESAPQG